jgi:two-component system phosphate regulon sensor histidine kinase PhoR
MRCQILSLIYPHIEQRDELGRLAIAFDTMRLNLRSTIATLASERQQTQAIIDASADGVILVDAERTILQFNPAAERLSGWKSYEAIGKTCWEVFGCQGCTPEEAEDHEKICPLKRASQMETEQSNIEIYACLRNGNRRWFAVNCAPVPPIDAASDERIVVGIHDISQLKAVDQLKSDFVAMVSHELRAPLTTENGSVETLSLLDSTVDHEAYQEVLGILHQQTRRLSQVVEEVLQLTRFEAGRLQIHLQPLSIEVFLRSIIYKMRQEWIGDERSIHLRTPEGEPLVWADPDLLEIVFRNLLDNVHKYTPVGSPIEIEVKGVNTTGLVLVQIIDHGPGIPPEQLSDIFERFLRGTNSSSQGIRGYGLGLYIVRELLRAHNGNIWAENRPEGGACFVLSLCAVAEDLPENVEDEKVGMTYEYDHTYD